MTMFTTTACQWQRERREKDEADDARAHTLGFATYEGEKDSEEEEQEKRRRERVSEWEMLTERMDVIFPEPLWKRHGLHRIPDHQ